MPTLVICHSRIAIYPPWVPYPGKVLWLFIKATSVLKRFLRLWEIVFPEHPIKAICFQNNYSSPERLLIPVAKSRHHAVRTPQQPPKTRWVSYQPPSKLLPLPSTCSSFSGSLLWCHFPQKAVSVLLRLGRMTVSDSPTSCCTSPLRTCLLIM